MKQKYQDILNEVLDEIDSAIKDPKGIVAHQRRLAFSLSLGAITLLEAYLDELNIFKSGAKIDHLKLKKKKEKIKEHISNQITSQIESIPKIEKLLDLAYDLEKDRNIIAYGKQISESILQQKINIFFDLKKETENA